MCESLAVLMETSLFIKTSMIHAKVVICIIAVSGGFYDSN